ncbi:MAG: S8 family serine peptidase [Bacteroidales bacterium]|nr:S8 family serine peptidase [Bacteroidales bacterium]
MKRLLKLKWMACMLVLCIGFGGTVSVVAQDLPMYEENTLYVKFKDHSEISAKKMLNAKSGSNNIQTALLGINADLIKRFQIEPQAFSMALFDNPVLDKTFMISIDPQTNTDIEQLKEELEKDPNVEYVERVPFNRIFSVNPPVNDPYYGIVGDGDKKLNVSWHLDMINAEKAWEIQKGTPNTVIAVVDNAIWGDHEDLQIPSSRQYNCNQGKEGNSAPPVGEAIQNRQCDLDDLRKSECLAFDFSHGTHCAGAIAAINNNGTGIASIGGGVSLLAVGGPSMQWPSSIMKGYQGIVWALQNGAKVISCSWGSAGFSKADENVVKACYENGVIIIAAAGNSNTDEKHYPAAYYPYVICVGSVDADSKKSSFSNYGPWIDILSPGGSDTTAYKTEIFSTTFCQNQYSRVFGEVDYFDGKYYDEMSGTSMATPILAGVVALMVSKDPTLTTDQVRAILQNTGHAIHQSHRSAVNEYCSIVDAYEALHFMSSAPTYLPPVDTLLAEVMHDSVLLTWEAPETTETIKGYCVYRNGQKIADEQTELSFLDTRREHGASYRYAVEPIYEKSNYYTSRAETDITISQYYKISVSIRPNDTYGTVEGAGEYAAGDRFLLTATPNPGNNFEHWTDESGAKYISNPLNGPANRNKRFFAFFSSPTDDNEDLQLLKKAVLLSPNPAKDAINIQCEDYELQHVRISDTRGRIVYNAGCVNCGTHSLDIAIGSWGKGTYIVQVTTSKGTVSHKLIKR